MWFIDMPAQSPKTKKKIAKDFPQIIFSQIFVRSPRNTKCPNETATANLAKHPTNPDHARCPSRLSAHLPNLPNQAQFRPETWLTGILRIRIISGAVRYHDVTLEEQSTHCKNVYNSRNQLRKKLTLAMSCLIKAKFASETELEPSGLKIKSSPLFLQSTRRTLLCETPV